jgi:hypothetical protein
MNIYKYYSEPGELISFDKRYELVTELALEHVKTGGKPTPRMIKTIAAHPRAAFVYAQDIIKGQFPEGEDAINTNPTLAYKYAKDVIKKRFKKGEEYFLNSDSYIANEYKRHFGLE